MGKWWEQKWYWALWIVSTFFGVLILDAVLFPETPLSRSVVYAVTLSVGVSLTYFAYMGKSIFKIQPKTLRRILNIDCK